MDLRSVQDCSFYIQGKCLKGATCPFKHDSEKASAFLLAHREAQARQDCYFFVHGRCSKGSLCPYKHDESKLLSKSLQPERTAAQPNPTQNKMLQVKVTQTSKPLPPPAANSQDRKANQKGGDLQAPTKASVTAKASTLDASSSQSKPRLLSRPPSGGLVSGKQQAPKSLNVKTPTSTSIGKEDGLKRDDVRTKPSPSVTSRTNGKVIGKLASELNLKNDKEATNQLKTKRRTAVENFETVPRVEKKGKVESTQVKAMEAPPARNALQGDGAFTRASTKPVSFQPPKTIDEIRKAKQQKLKSAKTSAISEESTQVDKPQVESICQPNQLEKPEKEAKEAQEAQEDSGLQVDESLVDIDVGDIEEEEEGEEEEEEEEEEEDFDDFEAQMRALEDAL